MINEPDPATALPDPAAVFSCALSLWQASQNRVSNDAKLNLSECYHGMDQFMRELMRIANLFETWACEHLDFKELNDVWPYLMEDKFGNTCMGILQPTMLMHFDETDCLRVALHLRLPVILDGKLPVPFDLILPNPSINAGFREFRIQTIRDSVEYGQPVPFVADDEPFDEEFGIPYFGIYGIDANGELEHIADRPSYLEAIALARKIAPGIAVPLSPTFASAQYPAAQI
jgi:hypothetical protein